MYKARGVEGHACPRNARHLGGLEPYVGYQEEDQMGEESRKLGLTQW